MADTVVLENEPVVPGSLRDQIRTEVEAYLRDPLLFPQEFSSWVPQWVELVGIQTPRSNVVGAYTTADDVGGLGEPAHGRPCTIRAGSSPYDFIQMTYDDIYGKWVSNATFHYRADQILTSDTNNVWTLQGVSAGSRDHISGFKEFYDAGLRPQSQITAWITSGDSTIWVRPAFMYFNTGGTTTTTVGTGPELNLASGAGSYWSSDTWTDTTFTASLVDGTYLVAIEYKTDVAASRTIFNTAVTVRWVADPA